MYSVVKSQVHIRAVPFASVQVDHTGTNEASIFRERHAFVERMFAPAAATADPARRISTRSNSNLHSGPACGGMNPAPIRVGAGESCLDQRRIRDGASDLIRCRHRKAPHALRFRSPVARLHHRAQSASASDLQTSSSAQQKILVRGIFAGRFCARRTLRWRAASPYRSWTYRHPR